MASVNADIIVRDEGGSALALVEVRNQPLSEEQAGEIAAGRAHPSSYFLLVTPLTGYLWGPQQGGLIRPRPDAAFAMAGVISRYLSGGMTVQNLRTNELELIVTHWLASIAAFPEIEDAAEAEVALAKAGFVAAISGGTVAVGDKDASVR